MMEFVKKRCLACGRIRKFVAGSERDKRSVCGECWDWVKHP